jgi:hypothetical protein
MIGELAGIREINSNEISYVNGGVIEPVTATLTVAMIALFVASAAYGFQKGKTVAEAEIRENNKKPEEMYRQGQQRWGAPPK